MNTNSSIVLHLDSRFATRQLDTGKTTNYIYDLVESISVPNHELCEVSLYTATIPYSFYNVRAGVNDTFSVMYTTTETPQPPILYFSLPAGNYSATALKNRFIALLLASTNADVASLTFSIDYSRETLKYTLTLNPVPSNFQLLQIAWAQTTPLFGFQNKDLNYTFQQATISLNGVNTIVQQLSSEICIDINDSIHGLYIRQNLTTKSTLDNENGTFTNILARIPINTNAGGIIFHNPSNTTHRAITSLHSIQSIGCKLTDDQNRTIDLNGLHWQVSLLISFIPKQPRVQELTRITRRINERAEYARKSNAKNPKSKPRAKITKR
jgi:hypothetical protein